MGFRPTRKDGLALAIIFASVVQPPPDNGADLASVTLLGGAGQRWGDRGCPRAGRGGRPALQRALLEAGHSAAFPICASLSPGCTDRALARRWLITQGPRCSSETLEEKSVQNFNCSGEFYGRPGEANSQNHKSLEVEGSLVMLHDLLSLQRKHWCLEVGAGRGAGERWLGQASTAG